MATTSIWRVKGWLGKVVIYVENPDKTDNPAFYEKEDMSDKPINFYYEALKDSIAAHEKELSIPAKRRKPKHLGRYTKKAVRRRRKEAKRHA